MFMKSRRGLILVLSAPSGTGKTTLANMLVDRDNEINRSISVTTREKRANEINGKDYIFASKDSFIEMRDNNELLEHAQVFDNMYGTPKSHVDDRLHEGKDVIFCIDWQGGLQVKLSRPRDTVLIFLLPPSIEELKHRLDVRGMDTDEAIRKRLGKAKLEIEKGQGYDYILVNDDLEATFSSLHNILKAERLKVKRQRKKMEELIDSLNYELDNIS